MVRFFHNFSIDAVDDETSADLALPRETREAKRGRQNKSRKSKDVKRRRRNNKFGRKQQKRNKKNKKVQKGNKNKTRGRAKGRSGKKRNNNKEKKGKKSKQNKKKGRNDKKAKKSQKNRGKKGVRRQQQTRQQADTCIAVNINFSVQGNCVFLKEFSVFYLPSSISAWPLTRNSAEIRASSTPVGCCFLGASRCSEKGGTNWTGQCVICVL